MKRLFSILTWLPLFMLGCAELETDVPFVETETPTHDPDETPGEPEPEPGEEDPPDPSEGDPNQPPPPPGPGSEPPPPPAPSSCKAGDLVWPTTGVDDEQTLIHDAYGPRLLAFQGYDWHRGIDLPGDADDGGFFSPVYAVANAEIHAIGNRPNPNQGALSHYASSAGNVIVLGHDPSALAPEGEPLYSVYMHLDELPLAAFPARLSAEGPIVEVDLREYFYLDGAKANANNRGRQRPSFKSSGEPIEAYPRVNQHDLVARIGDTGATYEHLHFELREGSPSSADAVNPFAYLPHLDATFHEASVVATSEGLHARIEIAREPGEIGATTDFSQQLDVETVAIQVRGPDEAVVDELRFDFHELGLLDDIDDPSFELEGVSVTLSPHTFSSADAVWRLDVEFVGLGPAGFDLGPGEHYSLVVWDLCGNSFELAV